MSDETDPGFYIDQVPGPKGDVKSPEWTWALIGPQGETLARAGRAYPTKEDAQVAIAATKIEAREHEVPEKGCS